MPQTKSVFKELFNSQDPTAFDLDTVLNVLTFIRNQLVLFAAVYAIFGMVIVGWQYFTAYGDEAKAGQAKKTLTMILIGMVIVIFSEIMIYEAQRIVLNANNPTIKEINDVTNPLSP